VSKKTKEEKSELRDDIAKIALIGILSSSRSMGSFELAAKKAYLMAKAMLEEREKWN